ncbi:MAG: EAL domain-containing protein [Propionivibrio sp.]
MTDSSISQALLGRQPVVDAKEELVGYELTLQATPIVTVASRAAALVCAAYAELGIRSALGQHTAFLRIDRDFLHGDAIEALPSDAVVLELVLGGVPDETTLARCRALRDRRYSLALAGYRGLDERSRPLLTLVDIIKIDARALDGDALRELAGPLARLPLKLLAEGIETREAMERCRAIGFQLFQGRYFAEPEIVSGRRLSASQASLIRLANLAGRDADTGRIEEEFKRETALAVSLLRIVNSVGFGATRNVGTIRHAIALLGRRQLQRWLQLLLMAPAGKTPDASRSPLLQVAALRGRMMERLVEHAHPRDRTLADQGFITGIMSMMPAALGLPMQEILEQISLEPAVRQALTEHRGILGKTLELLECYDGEDSDGCQRILAELADVGIDHHRLNVCLAEALRWVNGSEP